jgi:hypothetical protein
MLAALIGSLLPAAAFLAVFVAGVFARSVVEHEVAIWRRSHPSHPSRPTAPRGGHRAAARQLEPQMRYPSDDDNTTTHELVETVVA